MDVDEIRSRDFGFPTTHSPRLPRLLHLDDELEEEVEVENFMGVPGQQFAHNRVSLRSFRRTKTCFLFNGIVILYVYISNNSHFTFTIYCLENKKHVFFIKKYIAGLPSMTSAPIMWVPSKMAASRSEAVLVEQLHST